MTSLRFMKIQGASDNQIGIVPDPLCIHSTPEIPVFVTDYLIEVAKGNIPGARLFHQFGRNDAVPDGAWAVVQVAASNPGISVPTTMRLAGGDANDIAGGTGAREVSFTGVNWELNEVTVSLETNGVNPSNPTAEQFWRVYKAWVSSCGTYGGTNIGGIDIQTTGGITIIGVPPGEGQSHTTIFTVPDKYTGFLLSVEITASTNVDDGVNADKLTDARMFMRQQMNVVTPPVQALRSRILFNGIGRGSGIVFYKPTGPNSMLPALTDIWFEAFGRGTTTRCAINYELLLVHDDEMGRAMKNYMQ